MFLNKKRIKTGFFIGIAIVIILIIGVIISIKGKNDNSYIVDACQEIQKNLSNPMSLTLQEVYVSDEQSTKNTTIDYIYRVYIVYKYTNSYDNNKKGTALYVIDDKGKTYFIQDSSNEQLYAYKTIAEAEIFGLSGWFEPSDNWSMLKSTELDKINNK